MTNTPNFDELINLLPVAFLPEKATGVDAQIAVHLSGEHGGDWVISIQNQLCSVISGVVENPKLTLEASDQDILEILSGRLDPMRAFMLGKLHVSGDNSLLLRMAAMFKVDEALMKKIRGV